MLTLPSTTVTPNVKIVKCVNTHMHVYKSKPKVFEKYSRAKHYHNKFRTIQQEVHAKSHFWKFVIEHSIFIHKTTAIWLFQEGESVI